MNFKNIDQMVLMIQKEVAEKINFLNFKKNNKYKFLLSIFSDYKIISNISNKVFYPKPKVQSSIVKLTIKKTEIDNQKLMKFVNLIFKNKRKLIKNNIKILNTEKTISELLNMRVEDLTNEELLFLFKKF